MPHLHYKMNIVKNSYEIAVPQLCCNKISCLCVQEKNNVKINLEG